MKKLVSIVLCILFLFGCKPNDGNDDWELDAQYNSIYNDSWRKVVTHKTENGIISYAEVKDAEGAPYYFPMYLSEEGAYSMDEKVSSTCTFNDVKGCNNLLPMGFHGIDYYKGKIYYIDYVSNESVSGFKINVNEANINGYDQKVAFTLIEDISFDEAEGIAYLEFHRNKMYVNCFGDFYIVDLLTKEIKKIDIPGVDKIWRMFFVKDTLYITTEEYDDGKTLHFDAILECDLEGNLKSLAYDNLCTMLIDENLIFYRNREDLTWHIYDRKTDEKWQINDTLYYYVLKYEDTYLLETINMLTDTYEITILDNEGKILHTKDYTNDTYYNGGLLYLGNRYYVSKIHFNDDMDWYGYYEITENGISDLIEIPR